MFERVCHTMMGVREASSFVPEIGTADTSGKGATNEEFALQIDNTASILSCVVQTQFAPHGMR